MNESMWQTMIRKTGLHNFELIWNENNCMIISQHRDCFSSSSHPLPTTTTFPSVVLCWLPRNSLIALLSWKHFLDYPNATHLFLCVSLMPTIWAFGIIWMSDIFSPPEYLSRCWHRVHSGYTGHVGQHLIFMFF